MQNKHEEKRSNLRKRKKLFCHTNPMKNSGILKIISEETLLIDTILLTIY